MLALSFGSKSTLYPSKCVKMADSNAIENAIFNHFVYVALHFKSRVDAAEKLNLNGRERKFYQKGDSILFPMRQCILNVK